MIAAGGASGPDAAEVVGVQVLDAGRAAGRDRAHRHRARAGRDVQAEDLAGDRRDGGHGQRRALDGREQGRPALGLGLSGSQVEVERITE